MQVGDLVMIVNDHYSRCIKAKVIEITKAGNIKVEYNRNGNKLTQMFSGRTGIEFGAANSYWQDMVVSFDEIKYSENLARNKQTRLAKYCNDFDYYKLTLPTLEKIYELIQGD